MMLHDIILNSQIIFQRLMTWKRLRGRIKWKHTIPNIPNYFIRLFKKIAIVIWKGTYDTHARDKCKK